MLLYRAAYLHRRLTAEQADVRVLEEGKKKLFGSVKARVEIAAKEAETPVEEGTESKALSNFCPANATDGERTVVFLEGLFELLNITACTELVSEGEKVEINVTAANTTAIIGKHGASLKTIGSYAREDMEKFFGTKVFLDLWVKVKENWRDSNFNISNFGFKDDMGE